jgi:glucuronoarabinoxylan endo-1,4-beta-xylanase
MNLYSHKSNTLAANRYRSLNVRRISVIALMIALMTSLLTQTLPPTAIHAQSIENPGEETQSPVLPDSPIDMSAVSNIVVSQTRAQTMTGFGVAGAWVGDHLQTVIDQQHQQEVLDRLFTNAGLGLSILRTKIEPNVASQGYNAGQDWLMQQAKQRGVTQFYSTPWTPPSEWEDSSNRLRPEYYDEYAQFLTDYLKMSKNHGITIGWLSLQNEPDLDTEYESCEWSELQLCSFVPMLRTSLNNNGLSNVKLLAPEAMGWSQTDRYADQLDSTGHSALLDVLATHAYGGEEDQATQNTYRTHLRDQAAAVGLPVWMTEWSDLDVRWNGTNLNDPLVFGIDDGLKWAGRVSNDLTRANTAAWLYWWIYNPNGFPNGANQGLIVRTPDNDFLYPKRFYAFAQFSRFIRPGAQRLILSGIPSSLQVASFRSPNGQSIVTVVVNATSSSVPVNLNFSQFNAGSSAQVYRTSASENTASKPSAAVSGGVLATTIAAKSVTTFIVPLIQIDPSTLHNKVYLPLIRR